MDKELILKYAPEVYLDINDPIPVKKVGVSIYENDGDRSRSFNRKFDFKNFEGCTKVIEYAYYYDYDIQHLYDLEHTWVFLDKDGNIVAVEGSYHGRFLNAGVPGLSHHTKDKAVMYSQPGKHGMLSDPKLMYQYSELFASCNRLAGSGGLDAPDRYLEDIHISDVDNQKVVQYIKKNLSFTPSMEFRKVSIDEADYIDFDELAKLIPQFIKKQLEIIL